MKKGVVIVIPLLVVLVLGGAVAYILFAPDTFPKPIYVRIEGGDAPGVTTPPPSPQSQPQPPHTETAEAEAQWGVMYPLDTKVVNLADPGGLRFLQVTIVLEFYPLPEYMPESSADNATGGGDHGSAGEEARTLEETLKAKIDMRRPVIDDLATTLLSSKTFSEVSTIEGKQALKDELVKAINEALGYPAVMNVYFTEFVVQ